MFTLCIFLYRKLEWEGRHENAPGKMPPEQSVEAKISLLLFWPSLAISPGNSSNCPCCCHKLPLHYWVIDFQQESREHGSQFLDALSVAGKANWGHQINVSPHFTSLKSTLGYQSKSSLPLPQRNVPGNEKAKELQPCWATARPSPCRGAPAECTLEVLSQSTSPLTRERHISAGIYWNSPQDEGGGGDIWFQVWNLHYFYLYI